MGQVVLVTGAGGFIGRRLVARLQSHAGWEVVATGRGEAPLGDLDNTGDTGNEKGISGVKDTSDASGTGAPPYRFLRADLAEPSDLEALGKSARYDTVIHLASLADFTDSPRSRRDLYRANVTATFQLLEMAKEHGSRFIFSSTGMVYGDQPGPFREDMEPRPVNFYALSKLMGEEMIRTYSRRYGLGHAILRASVVYGPGQKSGMFIPSAVEALVQGRDFPMTEGGQIRDFLFVDDCVRAFELALESGLKGVYNLASGVHTTMAEAARLAGEVAGAGERIKRGTLEYRPNELWEYYMDIGRLTADLGWRPEVGLKDGLERVVAHEIRNRV